MDALLLATLLAAAARAGEDGGRDLDDLLDSIPDIEAPAPPAEEEAKPAPAEEEDVSFVDYSRQVGAAALARWSVPRKVRKKHRGAVVQAIVRIAEDGAVTGTVVVRESGVRALDRSVEQALAALDRVPAPPKAYAADGENGVLVEFVVR